MTQLEMRNLDKVASIPHDLSDFLLSAVMSDGGLLVKLSKIYLEQRYPSEVRKQLQVFNIGGVRYIVRLHPGASCERGIGRDHVKASSKDFDDRFDSYLKPSIDDRFFHFKEVDFGGKKVERKNYAVDWQ